MRILVVDEESLNRFLLLYMLKQEGYTEVREAQNGKDALLLQEEFNPDIILIDVVLPDGNGYDIVKTMKSRAGSMHLPVIFLSAMDDHDTLVKCFESADDVVCKPFDQTILAAKIRAHARSRQLSRDFEAQHQELLIHQQKIEREHTIVEHIFNNALKMSPRRQQLMQYHIAPASNFNGDLFLVNTSQLGSLYFLIGDFTGHGLASAIGALPVAKAFIATSKKGLPIDEIATTLNSTLLDLLPSDMFFAAILVEIDPSGQKLTIWNGGSPDLLLLSSDGEIRRHFTAQHMALGILEQEEFESSVIRYTANVGDRLFAFTDGVIEVKNTQGKMLGMRCLENWLMAEPDIDINKLVTKLGIFKGPGKQTDDITVASFTCQPLANQQVDITPSLPWKISTVVEANDIRQTNPVILLVEALSTQPALHRHGGYIFTILSELYSNSLEHGLLGLDSSIKSTDEGFLQYYELRKQRLNELIQGQIELEVEFIAQQGLLNIAITDSGSGYDYNKAGEGKGNVSDSYGRGLELLQRLSTQIEYFAGGRRVKVIYHLHD
ncbi:SpoIIE family protein phosphatase [Alteromonadaceae bacterium BrNp21-10]|nr:SpoIIE family protein phosphatase [Alteromonadaceae bacterium BrNp21-10]